MKIIKNTLLAVTLLGCSTATFGQKDNTLFHQNIHASVDPKTSQISVTDTVVIPSDYLTSSDSIFFYLNKNLTVKSLNKNFAIKGLDEDSNGIAKKYYLDFKGKSKDGASILFPLEISGKIIEEIKAGAAEYARGFSVTNGTITETGVYLSGSSLWIPSFSVAPFFTFDLTVEIGKEWGVVSQGERTVNKEVGDKKIIKYSSYNPMDEAYLIAAKWTEFSLQAGDVEVQAFLRIPKEGLSEEELAKETLAREELANKYLKVTSSYLDLYKDLIGKYPYTKFALVENFWETGYGMPSFTLLGEKIIRFPFILYSSYPHELLHNYWGNGVFVDASEGNWCEGLTAYMADHLLQEQRGQGAKYRRTSLQKFTDFVNEENDFPVKEFMGRNNAAQEAIGYGKVSMINNMLRNDLGDDVFIKAYAHFYKNNLYKRANFSDIRKSFEEVSGKNLESFFSQWMNRKGAPTINLSNVAVKKEGEKHQLSFNINQTQKEDAFTVNIPVAVYLEGEEVVTMKTVTMNEKTQSYTLSFDKRPLRVDLDPEFNIMRRLDRKEVPVSLTQVFGEKDGVIIIPAKSNHTDAYQQLAEFWKKAQEAQGKTLEIVSDKDLKKLPSDKAVWVLGFENKFSNFINFPEKYANTLSKEDIAKANELKTSGALVFVSSNPENANHTVGFIGANNDDAITALTKKLSHYGKYGYLGFETGEAKNVLKGSIPALDSPLNFIIKYDNETPEIKAKIIPRKALATAENKEPSKHSH